LPFTLTSFLENDCSPRVPTRRLGSRLTFVKGGVGIAVEGNGEARSRTRHKEQQHLCPFIRVAASKTRPCQEDASLPEQGRILC